MNRRTRGVPTVAAPDALPRRQMLLVGLGVFTISVLSHFRTPILPEMGRELAMSATGLGLVTTAFAVGRLLTDLPAGVLVDRAGVRRMFTAAGVALALGGWSFGAAPSPAWVLAATVLLGVASALANTTGMTYFSSIASVERRGTSMAAFSVALLGGQAIGPTFGGLIAELGSWRTAMYVSAVIGLVLALAGVALGRRVTWFGAARAVRPTHGPTAGRRLAAHHRVVLYAVPFTSMAMLGSLPQTLIPIIGGGELGLSSASIGMALGVGGVCRMVASPVGGFLSDRISRKAVLVPAMLGQAAGVAVLATAATTASWLLSIVLISLFSFGGTVGATMLADLSGTGRMGRRLGSYRFVGDTGLIVGPAVTALVYDRVGQASAVLLVAGLLATVAVLVATVLPETGAPRAAG